MNTIIESSSPATRPALSREPRAARSARLPGWARALLTPVLFLLVQILLTVGSSFVPGLNDAIAGGGWTRAAAVTVSAISLVVVTVGVIALLMRYVDRQPLRRAGFVWTRHSLPALGLGIVLTVAIVLAVVGVGVLSGQMHTVPVPAGAWTPEAVALTLVTGLVMAFLLQSIPEELLFRGYLMQALADRPRVAAVASATLFAVIHLVSLGGQQNALERVLYLADPFGFGLLAAALVLKTRSVWAAVGVHAGVHVAGIIGQFLAIPIEGPYYWVTVGIAYAIAGILVLRTITGERVVIDR